MSRYIKNDVLAEVMRRCKGKCIHCGTTQNLQFGHIIAFSKGGSNSIANLVIECETCNKKKGTDFLPIDYLKLDHFIKEKRFLQLFKDFYTKYITKKTDDLFFLTPKNVDKFNKINDTSYTWESFYDEILNYTTRIAKIHENICVIDNRIWSENKCQK